MQILHKMTMESSQTEFSSLFSCTDSHSLKEQLRKTLGLFLNLVSFNLVKLLEVQCIGALFVTSILCLFTDLLNKLAASTRAVFLQRMLVPEVLLYAENVQGKTSES